MFARPLFLSSSLALAVIAAGQTSAPATPAGEKLHLDDFVVTATPLARAADEIVAPTTSLGGDALAQRLQPTLGETLSGQPGVDSTYFGPGASRPVIRGLGGDRVRVLTGGVGTIDASIVSPDHAVSLDPLLIERVEIVRGPAALLYGGGAIGGVVNVIDGRVPETLPSTPVVGRLEARGDTASDERAGAAVFEGAAGHFAWRLDGFERKTDDIDIPDFAKTAALRAGEEDPAKGYLPNSATSTEGAAFGLSYIGSKGHMGVAYSGFGSVYGTPAEEDVSIDLRQRRWDIHGEWLEPVGFLRAAKFNLGIADYQHVELEGEEIGTQFKNKGYEGRLELLHEKVGPFEGALGFQADRSDFSAIGEEAFLPPTLTEDAAVFLYEEAVQGDITWQFGARTERRKITPEDDSGLPTTKRTTATFSGGAVWKFSPNYALALSLSANERAPNAQELYADGPHAGTGVYEVGDPTLNREKSIGVDLSLRRRKGFVTGELSLFLNQFDGYIFEQDTGQIEEEDGLPIFAFVQRDAKLYGAEAEVTFHLHETKHANVDLKFFADTVRATNTSDNTPLPRTTPVRFGASLEGRHGPWRFNAEWRQVDDQRRVAPIETTTDGYAMVSAGVSRDVTFGRTQMNIFLRGNNLLDETARVHASFLKDVAPLPGRSATAGVRFTF